MTTEVLVLFAFALGLGVGVTFAAWLTRNELIAARDAVEQLKRAREVA